MNRLMCHVVAGYPDTAQCLELMLGMCKAGAAAIEVQVPFSDPIADGATIMQANDVALEGGMTTAGSFKLIREAREKGVDCDIYIMSYLQKVQHFGLEKFCQEAEKCGAKGLIIPDLPYDSPEYAELSGQKKLQIVPVLSPGMSEKRLKALLQAKPTAVYVTSQRGITGNQYGGTTELEQLASAIRRQSDAKLMIGFGIASLQDVKAALSIGDTAVIGSAIIKQLQGSDIANTLNYINKLAGANK